MEKLLKKRIGLIILLVIALVFPISLSNQARLNNRIIVTGLAIDKTGDNYEVTAQIVKTTPGTESAGKSAMVNFVTDSDETMVGALAKLTYRAGKVAAFSHTNFVILGEDLLSENISEVLDYFLRHKTIKSSALVLFAEGKASDELEKTKDVELSVGLGLQKVFLYKESESDGEMTTVLKFLNDAKSNSKTSTASVLSLMKNREEGTLSSSSNQSDSSSGKSSGDSSDSKSSESGSDSGGSASGGSESESSQSSSGDSASDYQYFEAISKIVCCKDGKYVGKLETHEEIMGYMIVKNQCESEDISLTEVSGGRLDNAKVGIKVNHKKSSKRIRFENGMPKLDIVINITGAEIEDLKNETLISELSKEEYETIKEAIKKDASQKVAACFDKAKQMGVDIFRAYDLAYKFHYGKTTSLFASMEEFLKHLMLNVEVNVTRLDY